MKKLTDKGVLDWLLKEDTKKLYDTEVTGLHFLRSTSDKKASVRYFYRTPSKQQKVKTLGRYPSLSLKNARKIALDIYHKNVFNQHGIELKQNTIYTIRQYFEKHYTYILDRNKSGDEMKQRIRQHFGHLFSLEIEQLTCTHIREWQSKKESEGLKHSTLVKVYGSFKAMFNSGVREGHIPENPIRNCRLIKNPGEPQELSTKDNRLFLTDEQCINFLKALDVYEAIKWDGRKPENEDIFYDRVKPSMLLLYHQGFRVGDVINMRWEYFNPENKTLRYAPGKISHKKPIPQTFPLASESYKVIMKWWKQNGCPTFGPMFPNPKTGLPYNKRSFKRVWPLLKKYGSLPPNLHLLTLRHNFASQMIFRNQDVFKIAKWMGTSVKMIEEHYGHLRLDDSRNALDMMPTVG